MSSSKVIESTFVWESDDSDIGTVRIPLRFKAKILRKALEMQGDDLGFMFFLLNAIGVPDETVDEMDVLELNAMFSAWQAAWQSQNEASLPEALRSSN